MLKKITHRLNPGWLFGVIFVIQLLVNICQFIIYLGRKSVIRHISSSLHYLIDFLSNVGLHINEHSTVFLGRNYLSRFDYHTWDFFPLLTNLLFLASSLLIIILLLKRQRDKKLLFCVLFYNVFQIIGLFISYGGRVTSLYIIFEILRVLACVSLLVLTIIYLSGTKPKNNIFFLMPAIFKLMSIIILITSIITDQGTWLVKVLSDAWIVSLIDIIATALLANTLFNIDLNKIKNKEKAKMQHSTDNDFYINLTTHVLLTIFTLGIWYLIWVYKTTEKFNYIDDDTIVYRSPVTQLLLCGFVPFYHIYWTYCTAQYVDIYAERENAESNIKTLCLILDIFIPIIPPIIMQEKLNAVCCGSAPKIKNKSNDPKDSSSSVKSTGVIKSADELKKYKDLFDSGVITQEEFDAKKKQILDL